MDTKKLHPNIGQIEVSVYNNGFDSKSRRYVRLQEVADIIITGRAMLADPAHPIKDLQTTARYKKAELPHEQYQEWKAANLPMFLVTGCFAERKTNGLIGPHTALINVDIDHVDNVQEMKANIVANEPALVMAGISPSGDGIKLIFHVSPTPTDAAEHRQITTQLHEYLSKKYKIPLTNKDDNRTGIDTNGRKLTFTCFFFHDPDLYLNENVPARFQGNVSQLPIPVDEPYDDFDWEKLNNCLNFYTADCGYDDWTDIGIALKHEGQKRQQEDIFFQRWDEWSQESETKYDASKMESKWEGFNKDNTEQITLGSIYHRAKENGWVAPTTQISKKTEQNRASYEAREAERYAEEQKLPMHLRPSPVEDTDLARILHYGADNFLIVNNRDIYIKTVQGSWDKVEIEQSNGSIDNILTNARKLALDEAEEHINGGNEYRIRLDKSYKATNSHIKALTGRLLSLVERTDHKIPNIRLRDFNNRVLHNPTLPLQYGAIDLVTGKILTPDEYSKYHALQSDYWAVEYDPEILDSDSHGCTVAKHLIEEHYGIELMSRLAYHLVTPNKSVDIINIPTSSAGKTALVEWLKAALGSVGLDSRSHSLTPKGDTYTLATAPLTEYLLYFYDEVDKLHNDIPAGILNEMTSEDLTISKKYQNPTPLPRTGTGILIGAAWPPIDGTAQGLDTRINYVYKKDLPPMSEAIKRTLMQDEDSHKYLLAWMVRQCMKWANSSLKWQNSKEADQARTQFFIESTPEVKQLLLDAYIQSENSSDHIPADSIKEVLSICTEKYNLLKAVTSTFPKSRRERVRINTDNGPTRPYVFTHLLIKAVEDKVEQKDIEQQFSKGLENDLAQILDKANED